MGINCRLCERPDCPQRAVPPLDRAVIVDPEERGILPYRLG
ncbi:short-chain fatty acyl-CoA regulator family protein [Bosea sp. (in: a-proteobacteria)]